MEDNITLELTPQETQLVVNALGELPAKVSMGLIAKIKGQFQKVLQEKEVKENEDG